MNSLLLLMGLLLVAYLGSFLVGGERSVSGVGLPSSVEWVVLGVVIGPQALGVVSSSVIDGVQSIIAVAVSWLMLTFGVQYAVTAAGRVRPSRIAAAILSACISAGAVFATVYFGIARVAPELGKDRLALALGLAAVSSETTRHVMRWARERHGASGPLTDLLDDIACTQGLVPVALVVALFALAGKSKLAWLGIPAVSGVTVGLGAILGALTALLLGREFRLRESWGTILGVSLLAIGVSAMVGLAYVAVLFVLGATLVLVSRHADEVRAMLEPTERGALLPIMIVCGVRIEPQNLTHTAMIFAAVLVVRAVSKAFVARFVAASRDHAGGPIGLGMMSSGALSMCIALACSVTLGGAVGNTILAVAAALCVAGELVGPPSLRATLKRAGELHPIEIQKEDSPAPPPSEDAKEPSSS
jgi:hypothetical protein